jgi:hypothetical protein
VASAASKTLPRGRKTIGTSGSVVTNTIRETGSHRLPLSPEGNLLRAPREDAEDHDPVT